ncbi:MAG TPA: serine hydrolase domain-containing protein [Steroidobacteraceae bacterium]|nr:serine hydrolase domain-containing protein [Steroidobacteraceae bacterium]
MQGFSRNYVQWLAVLLAALWAGAVLADAGAGRAARIDRLMRAYQGEVPGAAVLVRRDGRVLFERAYGYADLEAHRRVSPATNFRLASMTKQFTAAAVLLLAQDGRLSLEDPVRRWLPELPPATQPVRVRDLLTHVSGVIDYEELIPAGMTQQLHDADVLRLLQAENRTYFVPGSQYRYSDSGYALLALIVARAAHTSFAAFLQERIFAPLGMRGSVAYEAGVSQVRERAFGYRAVGSGWQRDDQSLTSAVLGDGGVYSSVEDLARWDAALYDARLLSDATRAEAFSPLVSTEDPHVQYGFGWRITGETLWHSGETVGFRNVIVRFPRRHFTVIVLSNRDAPEPYDTALAIARLYFSDAAAVRAAQVVVGPDSGAHPLPQAH